MSLKKRKKRGLKVTIGNREVAAVLGPIEGDLSSLLPELCRIDSPNRCQARTVIFRFIGHARSEYHKYQ